MSGYEVVRDIALLALVLWQAIAHVRLERRVRALGEERVEIPPRREESELASQAIADRKAFFEQWSKP